MTAPWQPLPPKMWDAFRVPVPGFTPKTLGAAYTISLAGVVRRSDGLIMLPTQRVTDIGRPTSLHIRLGGGATSLSMAQLMYRAFAEPDSLPTDHPEKPGENCSWIPWLRYDAPEDFLTRMRSCSIQWIVFTPFYQIKRFNLGHGPPKDMREMDVVGRDSPITRKLLRDAGYVLKKSRLGYFWRRHDDDPEHPFTHIPIQYVR